jgi:hypothetical protein
LIERGGIFDGLKDRGGVDQQLEWIRHQASGRAGQWTISRLGVDGKTLQRVSPSY